MKWERRSIGRWRWPVYLWLCLTALFLLADWRYPLPDPERVQSVIVLAEDGTPLRAFADSEGVWRYPVRLDEVSPLYVQALLTYEDRWFYYHPGVNPLALLRAGWQWFQHGRIISGGSTLTMQVARILDPHERSLSGKLFQMFRALQLEWHFSKEEILGFYLNLAPFGGPIEGVQTASYAYLHKPVDSLSHAEAALLAVLPQAPSRLRPDRHPERAMQYRNKVLERMRELREWGAAVVESAKMEVVYQAGFQQPFHAPLLSRRLKDDERYAGQARIETALDTQLQWLVGDVVRSYLHKLPDYASAAAIVMENETGLVRAYVGSVDFHSSSRAGHVDMVTAHRSPGSTLKPFLYGLAMDQGWVHSASLLSDAPLKLAGYAPKNFMRDYRGAVSVAEALQLSLNVPAVDMLQRITPAAFDARLRHAGVALQYPEHESANLSLILGGAGTSLEHLVRGFSGLARGGVTVAPRYTVAEPVVERRVLSGEASWIIADILRDVEPPKGFSVQSSGLAWKTGTSYGFRDAWSLGFNSRYTVGVWTGRPDGTPLPGQFGARAAGPLLFEIFQVLPTEYRSVRQPERVKRRAVCWPLGKSTAVTDAVHCQQRHEAWVIDERMPPTLSSLRDDSWSAGLRSYWVNPDNGLRVTAACSSPLRAQHYKAMWPVELHPWLSGELLAQMELPPFDTACPQFVQAGERKAVAIVGLDNSSQLRLDHHQDEAAGLKISLEANGGEGEYVWLVNGLPVGKSVQNQGLPYVFREAGDYDIVALDAVANADKVSIRVVRHD